MNQLIKINRQQLRISHQSEVLLLRKKLVVIRAEMNEMKQQMKRIESAEEKRKVTLFANGHHHMVVLDDIIYCQAEGSYTKVFFKHVDEGTRKTFAAQSQSVLVSKPLKYITELIDVDHFTRCHQSFLVNNNHVVAYATEKGMNLEMINGKLIPVSRRNKKMMLNVWYPSV